MEDHLVEMKTELENGNAQLLDVREQDEWDEGHLSQATLAPLSKIEEKKIPENLDKTKKVYLHCRTGRRVLIAEELLLQMGFQNVVALQEGFDDLVMEGFDEASN